MPGTLRAADSGVVDFVESASALIGSRTPLKGQKPRLGIDEKKTPVVRCRAAPAARGSPLAASDVCEARAVAEAKLYNVALDAGSLSA